MLTVILAVFRLLGLAETVGNLIAKFRKSPQEKIIDEDHRELDIAARPDLSPDDILARMRAGKD